jgi:glycosyltransferase involved in cell wall biosynthesis
MRLGGFVIHGNNRDTLGPCLDSLLAVCDEVVAVDSCSTDGSAELTRARGVRAVIHPWEGYGAARVAAAEALRDCDYLFFLDSDERLADGAAEAIRAWRDLGPTLPHYRLPRRDWAELPSGRFLFRTERHVRLVRADAAAWRRTMIVHEALPRREAGFVPAPIEHRFATAVEGLAEKQEKYALLWAIRAHAEGRRPRSTAGRRVGHVLRDGVVKGALFRGGLDALRLAWAVSNYHEKKYMYLREIEAGGHPEKVRAFAEGRFAELFR